MKKTLQTMAVIGLLVLPLIYGFQRTRSGDIIQPVLDGGPTTRWTDIGNLTASQATPAVGARDWATMVALTDAKTIQWDVPQLAPFVDIRLETKADADAHVIEIWVAVAQYLADGPTEDQFTLGAILTLTGGKQQATVSNFFVDTIVVTASNGVLIDDDSVLDSATDRMAIYRVNMKGWRKVIVIATTFEAATTLYAHARW